MKVNLMKCQHERKGLHEEQIVWMCCSRPHRSKTKRTQILCANVEL